MHSKASAILVIECRHCRTSRVANIFEHHGLSHRLVDEENKENIPQSHAPVLYALKTSSLDTCDRDLISASRALGSSSESLSSPASAAASAASSWPSKNFNARFN